MHSGNSPTPFTNYHQVKIIRKWNCVFSKSKFYTSHHIFIYWITFVIFSVLAILVVLFFLVSLFTVLMGSMMSFVKAVNICKMSSECQLNDPNFIELWNDDLNIRSKIKKKFSELKVWLMTSSCKKLAATFSLKLGFYLQKCKSSIIEPSQWIRKFLLHLCIRFTKILSSVNFISSIFSFLVDNLSTASKNLLANFTRHTIDVSNCHPTSKTSLYYDWPDTYLPSHLDNLIWKPNQVNTYLGFFLSCL